MGNTLFTSVCRREEVVDFEDISDATFDFISVAVHKDNSSSTASTTTTTSTKTNTRKIASSSCVTACDSVRSKIVAVVPVALEPCLPSRTIVGHAQAEDDGAMSFNDRLNMLTWDPETTPLPKPFKHNEMYVFDEYAPQPTNTPTNAKTKTHRSKDGWIRRAVDKYHETKTRRRDATQRRRAHDNQAAAEVPTPRTTTKKRSLRMSLWGKRTHKTTKNQPYQLPLMSSGSDLLDDDDDETQRFLFDQEEEPVTPLAQDLLKTFKTKRLSNGNNEPEPISDTESDDSGSDVTTLCQFYTRFEGAANDSDHFDDSDSDSDSDWSEWTRSSSTSSCYFSAAEDDANDNQEPVVDEFHQAPVLATPASLSDYLCECGDCPTYMAIERDVTNSNCWMNETERRALCRVLQAYSSFSPKSRFCKDMIAAAEECLLVFQGDELAAFHAFTRLAQTKW